jgi:hypothetical protein
MKIYTAEEMLNMLREGHVRFTYFKKEGERREALGTLHPDRLPPQPVRTEAQIEEAARKAEETRAKYPNLITYFDEESGGWRRFNMEDLVHESVVKTNYRGEEIV